MSENFKISRRSLLGGTAGAAVLGLGGAANAQKPLVVGFIYVGPSDDYGYNQAHAEARRRSRRCPGVKVVEEEKVPETSPCRRSMESMINQDGATLMFPTSFGYFDPHMLKVAAKYPQACSSAHCGGLWTGGQAPEEHRQLLRLHRRVPVPERHRRPAHATKSEKLGFVAAKPIPQVLRNINAFTLGAQVDRPEDHHAGDLHRRLVDAGQGGRGDQQPDRPGRRRRDLPRRLPQGRRSRPPSERGIYHLRLPRQPGQARAQGLPDRRRMELGARLHALHRKP